MTTMTTPAVVTEVTLDTQQIRYLIDTMWNQDPHMSQQLAKRHHVDDAELEQLLEQSLNSALSELSEGRTS